MSSLAGQGAPGRTGEREPDRAVVEKSLERILHSPSFQGSRRCQELLRYLVIKRLEGDTAALKERLIGSAIFGRDPSYDTAADAIVRVKANEVRKRLAAYYGETGRDEPIRIYLPVGSYVPVFEWAGNGRRLADPVEVSDEPGLPPEDQPRPPATPRSFLRTWWLVPAAASAIVVLWWLASPQPGGLERFWEPYLESKQPVLICVPVRERWFFEPQLMRLLQAAAAKQPGQPGEPFTLVPGDVKVVPDGSMSVQNFRAILRLTDFLARRKVGLEMRLVPEVTTEEIRRKQVVLIGAYHNPWAMDLNRGMRYSFQSENEGSREACWVRDEASPSSRTWIVPRLWPHAPQTVDYAIISRTFLPDTRQVVVSLAGINGFGTQVAAEFLSTSDYWNQFDRLAPANWQRKSCQIVLETRVIREVPNPPRILAIHCW